MTENIITIDYGIEKETFETEIRKITVFLLGIKPPTRFGRLSKRKQGENILLIQHNDVVYRIKSIQDIIEIFLKKEINKEYNFVERLLVNMMCDYLNTTKELNNLIRQVGGFKMFEDIINNIDPEKLKYYYDTTVVRNLNFVNMEQLLSIENIRNTIYTIQCTVLLRLITEDGEESIRRYWDVVEKSCIYITDDDENTYFMESLILNEEQWSRLEKVSVEMNYDLFALYTQSILDTFRTPYLYYEMYHDEDFKHENYYHTDERIINSVFELCKLTFKIANGREFHDLPVLLRIIKLDVLHMLITSYEIIDNPVNLKLFLDAFRKIKKNKEIENKLASYILSKETDDKKRINPQHIDNFPIYKLEKRLEFYTALYDPESTKYTLLRTSYNAGMRMESRRIFDEILGNGITTEEDDTIADIIDDDDMGTLVVIIAKLMEQKNK